MEKITTEATTEATTAATAEATATATAEVEIKKVIGNHETSDISEISLFKLFYNLLNNENLTKDDLKIIVTKTTSNSNDKIQKYIMSIYNLAVKYVTLKIVIKFDYLYFDTIKKVITFLSKVKGNTDTFKHCKNSISNTYKKTMSPYRYNIAVIKKVDTLIFEYIETKAFTLSDSTKENIFGMSNDDKKVLLVELLKHVKLLDKSILLTEAEAKKVLNTFEVRKTAKAEAEVKKAEAEAKKAKAIAEKVKAEAEAKAKADKSRKIKTLEKKIKEAKTEKTKTKAEAELKKLVA